MTLALEADIVDRCVMPDAGDDVLQLPPTRLMKQHVIGDNGFDPEPCRHVGNLMEPHLVVGSPAQAQRYIGSITKNVRQLAKLRGACGVRQIRHQNADHAFRVSHDIVPVQNAVVLAAARLAKRDEPGQPRICRTIHRIDQQRHTVGEVEATANDEAETRRAGCFKGADDACERITIDDADRTDPKEFCSIKQLLRRRGTTQKRKMCRDLELGIAHANIPWQNQRCDPVSGSIPSPERNTHKRSPASSSMTK